MLQQERRQKRKNGHPTKNGSLKPSQVTSKTNKAVWWQCKEGHEWQAVIKSRTLGNGCPYCSGYLAITGKTDLATVNPKLAKEWHPTKNGDLLPTTITAHSSKKVWWLCSKGHEWQAAPSNRCQKGVTLGCPICSSRKILSGFNDLVTTHPGIAAEWHPTKNDGLLPSHVSYGSKKKVWWKCEKGHEWESSIYNRTHNKSSCPICTKNNTYQQL